MNWYTAVIFYLGVFDAGIVMLGGVATAGVILFGLDVLGAVRYLIG